MRARGRKSETEKERDGGRRNCFILFRENERKEKKKTNF